MPLTMLLTGAPMPPPRSCRSSLLSFCRCAATASPFYICPIASSNVRAASSGAADSHWWSHCRCTSLQTVGLSCRNCTGWREEGEQGRKGEQAGTGTARQEAEQERMGWGAGCKLHPQTEVISATNADDSPQFARPGQAPAEGSATAPSSSSPRPAGGSSPARGPRAPTVHAANIDCPQSRWP